MSDFAWRESGGIEWLEARLPGARAAFTARRGGASDGPYRSLNLGLLTDDDPACVAENRRRAAAALGRDPRSIAMGLQVHGAAVQVHRGPPVAATPTNASPRAALVESDVQATAAAAVTPLVVTADCFPVVVAGLGAVAVAHCGWRGTVAGVVGGAVAAVCRTGRGAPEGIHAAIGPGIGACCYSVGPDLEAQFAPLGYPEALTHGRLDLALVIRRELARAGVPGNRVRDCGICTSCSGDLLFSHRRDGGVTGRQAALAWLA